MTYVHASQTVLLAAVILLSATVTMPIFLFGSGVLPLGPCSARIQLLLCQLGFLVQWLQVPLAYREEQSPTTSGMLELLSQIAID